MSPSGEFLHDGGMNWAPPTIDASTPPPPAPPPPPESDEERRGLSAVPAAAWIALLGSTLILFAAAAVVASNWSTIGQGFRVAGLAAVTVFLLMVAERSRNLVPTTAGIIAHVGTYLVAFLGIAVMSLFGFTWPTCLVVGGAALVLATQVGAARWRRVTMHLGQVAGFAMVATGLGALAGTTAGLIAVILAVGLLVAGAQRRSAALSLLAVFSPALTALADAGIGEGTLARAGLIGERLGWSGPTVGLIAATVVGAIALRRRNNPLMLVAAASPILGLVAGLAQIDGSAVAWWSLPALGLIAAELGWWLLPSERFRSEIGEWITAGAGIIAALAWLAPVIVQFRLFNSDLTHPWAIPTAITALAVALTTLRWKSSDSGATDLGITGMAAALLATVIALDVADPVVALVAVVAVAAAAFLSRRLGAVAVLGTAWWAGWTIIALEDSTSGRTTFALALLLALVGIVVFTRARIAAAAGVLGWLELSLIGLAAVGIAEAVVAGHGPATALIAMAVVALLAAIVDRTLAVWTVAAIGATGAAAFDAAIGTAGLDAGYWVGWAGATIALATLWAVHRSPIASFASASAAVVAVATATAPFGVGAEDFTVMAMLGVTALTGLAFTMQRRTPLDAAAVTAGAVLLTTTTFDVHPAWASGSFLLIGLQLATYGAIVRSKELSLGGVGVAVIATASWWFTTGLNEWFLEVIEPADIRAADLWLGAAALVALVAGITVRSTLQVNSWVAYSAALFISGMWLIPVGLERGTVWALPLLLTIGVAAAASGAWQRLAAPLVGGTVLTVIGVFLATGSDLTAIPPWTWLAIGGGALLGTAVLIERAGRPGSADIRELVGRWN